VWRYRAPLLDVGEGIFYQMALAVEVFVVEPLGFAVGPRRDLGLHALRGSLLDNGIAVVAFVGNQVLSFEALN